MQQIPVPFLIVFVVFLFVFARMALYIIRPFEKGLVESFGKFSRTVGSGLNLIVPFYQTIRKVDMREQVLDVPPQDVITKDNVAVTVDAIIYFKVTDPFKVLYNVANFIQAAINLAQTNLRNVIGDMLLDETLTSRLKINTTLREVLDEATDAWGVKVTRVELRKIDP
ncbi:MAG: paraslipin, partial [Elusimicrobiota bacterium]|nr:paraslipin [Elusimicrobiota bacterium]